MPVLTSVIAPPAPNPVDLLFHAAGQLASHPEAVPNVAVVAHLTGTAPDLPELRASIGRRLHLLPCLTHVLTTDDDCPRWSPHAPDLEEHVFAHLVPAGPDRLDETVRELLRGPLPAGAPAWRLVLLSGHAPGKYCLALFSHHEVQDAANLVTVLETLLGPEDIADPSAAAFPGPVPSPEPRWFLDTTAFIWRNTRPHGLWNTARRPLSGRRHILWTEVPSRLIEETGRAYDATANDVHMAALAHAITRWAGEHHPEAASDPLPLMLPVNLRTRAETGLPGNRFFLARLDLPGGSMTAARRLGRTSAATAVLKDPAYKQTLHRITQREPKQTYHQLVARTAAPDRLTAVASIFRVRQPLAYLGDPVERVVPVICCPDGFPLTSALFLYAETSTVCFQIDRALPGAETIPLLWRRAVDDMATCADTTPKAGGR
ncbi:wax ester/triacylglycerol synthase domain-containing protein [Streptomyces sp. HD]|uniref:wax ester/triacylglycerol synthase domain-containing protein n=1 Tax=Streptomyces sp. HD TaxID=3020892 RepID=UPI00232CE34C|nr:wax ester/triacylglycerol synthase domain-containing protein [Streptomyces sp. HD]MDC0770202.1 wax ester/triacylglycerol synthase family O-acyltransferase [Streptomyces sp. HD]